MRYELGMERSVDANPCLSQDSDLARVIGIQRILIPEMVVVCVDAYDPSLNDRIAAGEARKLVHEDRGTSQSNTNACGIEDGIGLRVANYLNLFIGILQ